MIAVDPVVEPVPQVARPGVGVAACPKPVKRTLRTSALSSPSVSFRKSVSGAWWTITPPLAKQRLVGMLRLVGEDGELVGLAVAVGVLADRDPVAALALAAASRWGSRPSRRSRAGRGGPRPSRSACRSPARRRTAAPRSPSGMTRCFMRLGRRERLLHLADRLALRAPACAGRVERDLGRARTRTASGPSATRGRRSKTVALVRRPADAALDQVVEAGVAPGPGVVAVGGVEDAALALRADPGPGLRRRPRRRGSGGRGGPSCCAWCGRRSRPRCGTVRGP